MENTLYMLVGKLYAQVVFLNDQLGKTQVELQKTKEQLGLLQDGSTEKRISDK